MSLPYYSMYPKDFDTDAKVRAMEDCELGLYLRCLNHSWVNDGLPAEPDEVRRLFRDQLEDFARKWPRVELCFPVAGDGRRRNPRQEKERESARKAHEAAVEKAKKRWEKEETCSGNAPAKPRHMPGMCSTSGSGSVSVENQNSETRAREEMKSLVPIQESPMDKMLDEVCELYRRAGVPVSGIHRGQAAKMIGSMGPTDYDHCLVRLPNYVKRCLQSGRWRNEATTKALVNVLRDGDWDVEITPRVLPQAREPSAREAAHERAAEKFRRME